MSRATEHDRYVAEAQDRMDAALRAKSPQERLAVVDGMWQSARSLISARLRADHPDWSDTRIDRETVLRLSYESD